MDLFKLSFARFNIHFDI